MEIGKINVDDLQLIALFQKHDVSKIYLFGSALRDDFNEKSDIDFLVEFNNKQNKSLFDLIGLQVALEDLTGRKIDLIENGSIQNPYRKKTIMDTARLIYAA